MLQLLFTSQFFLLVLSSPVWGPCPFNSTRSDVVCSTVSVPLDWFTRSQGNITNFVSKIPSLTPKIGTVWFLNGGSGVGGRCLGEDVTPWITYYTTLGFDFVAPDFRGTGSSIPKLDCPDNIYDVPSIACADYFQANYGPSKMYYYSLTQGAYDLNYLIETLGGPGPHYVQGDSFGTFWGQKYATIFPEQADAFVFESFVAMNRYSYFEAPQLVDWVGRQILNYCGLDPVCAGRVTKGTDVVTTVEGIFRDIKAGTFPCLSQLPSEIAPDNDWYTAFQELFGHLLGTTRSQIPLTPAFVYRLQRCSAEDVKVITYFWNVSRVEPPPDFTTTASPCDISNVILYNMLWVEGINEVPPPSYEEIYQISRSSLFTPHISDFKHNRELYDAWPRYAPDKWNRKMPQTSKPILLVAGDVDLSTPYPQSASAYLSYKEANPNTYISFVHLPTCPHVALLNSMTPSGIPCGLTVVTQFFQNGGQLKDDSCTKSINPVDWLFETPSSQNWSIHFFGVADGWGYSG